MPAGVSAWTPLANLTLSSAQSSVTFSSISGAYRDLVLVLTAQCNTNSQELTYLRFNGDTGNNYPSVYLYGTGSSAASSSSTISVVNINNTYFDQGNRGQMTYQILDYAQTDKHKSVLGRADGSAYSTNLGAARWANTSAITTILVMSGFSGFAAGSTFALYGVSA